VETRGARLIPLQELRLIASQRGFDIEHDALPSTAILDLEHFEMCAPDTLFVRAQIGQVGLDAHTEVDICQLGQCHERREMAERIGFAVNGNDEFALPA
jgi:hypothetical protein